MEHTSIETIGQATNVAFLAVPTYKGVQEVFQEAKAKLGEILSAFEFLDQEGLDCVLGHQGVPCPVEMPEGERSFYVLLETSGSNKDHDDEVGLPVLFFALQ